MISIYHNTNYSRGYLSYEVCENGGVYVSTFKNDWDISISDSIRSKAEELDRKKKLLVEQGLNTLELNVFATELNNHINKLSVSYIEFVTLNECSKEHCSCKDTIKEKNARRYQYGLGVKKFSKVIPMSDNLDIVEEGNKIIFNFYQIKVVKSKSDLPEVKKVIRFKTIIDIVTFEMETFKITPSGKEKSIEDNSEFYRFINKSRDLNIDNFDLLNDINKLDKLYNRTGFKEYMFHSEDIKFDNFEEQLSNLNNSSNYFKGSYIKKFLKYLSYYNNNKLIESILKSETYNYGIYCIKEESPLKDNFKDEFPMSKGLLKYLNNAFINGNAFRKNDIKIAYLLFSKMETHGGYFSEEILNSIELEILSDSYNAINTLENWKTLVVDYQFKNKELYEYLLRAEQFQGIDKSETIILLNDYVRMGTELNVEFDKKTSSLKKNHDLLVREYNFMLNENNKRDYSNMRKKLLKYEFENNTYKIMVPEHLEDIIKEGKALKHCVGSYADSVIKGKTVILFVRDKLQEEVPYYTLEVKNNRVVQCKGRTNKAIDNNNLKTFIEIYKEKLI